MFRTALLVILALAFAVFLFFISKRDTIIWPKTLWAKYKQTSFSFSFRYPPNLVVKEDDVKDSPLLRSLMHLVLYDSKGEFGYVDLLSYKQTAPFKNLLKREAVIEDGKYVLVNNKRVYQEIYWDEKRAFHEKYVVDIDLESNSDLRLKFVLLLRESETAQERVIREQFFREIWSSVKYDP